MKEKLMILGAGRGQVDLIQTAKDMGYTTVVVSTKGNYPGFALADQICYVDISDAEAVAEAAKNNGVSGIATACLDTGIAALGYACEKNGLVGLTWHAAQISGDKLLMKDAFIKNNVSTARYKKVSTKEDLFNVVNEFGFPVIVKAVDLQGSRGINIAYNEEELMRGYENTMAETARNFCIVEEFIEGEEFGVQAFVVNGKLLYLLPSGNVTFHGVTNVPIGHYVPLEEDKELLKQIEEQTLLAIKATGLDNCCINMDFIKSGGRAYVIELTGRLGANCLPQLISLYYGVDVNRLIVSLAMGEDPTTYFNKLKREPMAAYAQMLISDKSGTLKRIIDTNSDNQHIVEITYFVKEGDFVNKFANSKDCLGQVVVKGESLEQCKALIEDVIENIKFEVE